MDVNQVDSSNLCRAVFSSLQNMAPHVLPLTIGDILAIAIAVVRARTFPSFIPSFSSSSI